MKGLIIAAGAALAVAGTAVAGGGPLSGTSADISTDYTGEFATTVGGPFIFGTPSNFPDPGFPAVSLDVLPATLPGFDLAIELDYVNFAFGDFAGEFVSMQLTGLDIDAASAALFGDDGSSAIGSISVVGGDVIADWTVDEVLAFDVSGVADVSVFVGVNLVPTPGAAAAFGVFGLAAVRRRR